MTAVTLGDFGSAELTNALPFLGKYRERFTYCVNPESIDDPHAPALLLLAWNFAQQRQVDKYIRWYFERGFGSVLVMRPTAYHTYAFDPQKHVAPALLRFIEWAKTDPTQLRRKLVIHCFSGSCYLYIRMLKIMRDDFEDDVGQGDYGLAVLVFLSPSLHMHLHLQRNECRQTQIVYGCVSCRASAMLTSPARSMALCSTRLPYKTGQ
jgi:hypothetical protein